VQNLVGQSLADPLGPADVQDQIPQAGGHVFPMSS
jgi:hypothetical protein